MVRPVIHPRLAAHIARVSLGAMPDLATVSGTRSGVLATVAEGVPVRIERDTETLHTEQRLGAGTVGISYWTLTFPRGTDVRQQDEVTVGTRVFAIMHPYEPQSYSAEMSFQAAEVI